MVMSHCAQTGGLADRRPNRPQPAGLILIDRWQQTSYRVDLQQTENIDCWISLTY